MKKFRGEFSDREMSEGDMCGGTVRENFPGDFYMEMSRGNVRGKLSGTGVQIPMQDYKSLRVVVVIWAQTHTHTDSFEKHTVDVNPFFLLYGLHSKNTDNSEQHLTEPLNFF